MKEKVRQVLSRRPGYRMTQLVKKAATEEEVRHGPFHLVSKVREFYGWYKKKTCLTHTIAAHRKLRSSATVVTLNFENQTRKEHRYRVSLNHY